MSRNRAQLALGPLALALILTDLALAQGPRWVHRQGGEAHGVHFPTSSVGAIAEDGGRIRYWDDPNQEWVQAFTDLASRDDLKGIFFLDEDRGWAVGLGGTVLQTTDSGRNWTRIATILDYSDDPKPAELWDILMTSTGAGWVVGSDGVIAQTSNNWQSWSVPTQLQGVIAGFGGTDPEDPYDIKILFDGTIVVAADWGATYRRDPSTQLWSRIPIAVGGPCDPSGGSYLELWSLDFIPGTDDGWCVGGNGTNGGQLYQTTNGGASWTRYTQIDTLSTGGLLGSICGVPEPAPSGCQVPTQYACVVLPSANGQPATALSAGYESSIHRWYPANSSSRLVYDICTQSCTEFSSAGPYWVQEQSTVGSGISSALPPMSALHSLKTVVNGQDVVEAWVVGRHGLIQYSSDRGATWAKQGTDHVNRHVAGDFLSATTGVTIGQGRMIKRTTNAGLTLTPVYPSSQLTVADTKLDGIDIALSSAGYGVAVGEQYECDGTVSRIVPTWVALTTDGGSTWTPWTGALPGTTVELHPCGTIPGSNTVFIAGRCSTGPYLATITHSGGSWGAWTQQTFTRSTAGRTIKAADFIQVGSAIHGVVVGTREDPTETGLAMYTENGGSSWINIPVTSAVNGSDHLAVAIGTSLDQVRVTTSNGKLLERQTNGDLEVETVSIPANVVLRGLDYKAGTWVACGDKGTVLLRSGSSWTSPKSQTSTVLYSVSFDAADHGFLIGLQSFLGEYTD